MSDPLHYRPEDALYGSLGEFARRSAEHIETDVMTLYAQLLTVFGTLIGRRVKCMGGDSEHHCNLFTLIVGDTAVGKGGAWNRARRFAEAVDPKFKSLWHSDIQSAQALIRLVADEARQPCLGRRGKKGPGEDYDIVVPAVTDKRCLIASQEMQAIFTVKGRSGNTVAPVLKQAWDGETLENNTKGLSLRATHPHVSVLGHITKPEFGAAIMGKNHDRSNGFYNRFIILIAKKERSLPFGAPVLNNSDLEERLRASLLRLGSVDPLPSQVPCLEFEEDARKLWEPFYMAVTNPNDQPFFRGLHDFWRVPPITKRLALLYAALDGTPCITAEQFQAAKAFYLLSLDGLRSYLMEYAGPSCQQSETSRAVGKLRDSMRQRPGEYNKSELWQMIGNRPTKDIVAEAIQELVSSGEWETSATVGDNTRTVPLYRPANMKTDHCNVQPAICPDSTRGASVPRQDPDTGHREVDGHRIKLGKAFTVMQTTCGYSLADAPVSVARGDTGHLACYPDDRRAVDRDWLDGIQARKPQYQVVYVNESVMLLPPKAHLKWFDDPNQQVA
jgi:hypothetical protein